ncbi:MULTISPECIES: alanine/glycine:cation symporter family protein [Megasphaera]|uniref:Amino acid carrier protein n=1 Tax=Megasphaera vaginalis (ex Srinivasan et al. 2021) TaxID=1111454 RepID=U7UC39_9FIRM|nr:MULTISPECIES: alanine/glycine:cation symporter family protein [Megasphaera]ERT56925.1 amino acid carrier protein [Megasphaera vaginalis (ex Srinivasan et al. 2021)]
MESSFFDSLSPVVMPVLDWLDGFLYYPVLVVVLLIAGLYFTSLTGLVQFRMFAESIRVVAEKPQTEGAISSFQALMVSTASRVGTGNIVGVSTAICLGGAGAVFWMWVVAVIGGASAFIESTLAQIYKKKDSQGGSYGGPAYYIENALHSRFFAVIFAGLLIMTYAVGFNLVASFNLQSTFAVYSFYNPDSTPMVIGAVLAVITGYCIIGGGKRIVHTAALIVPLMGLIYVLAAVIVIIMNISILPHVFAMILSDAFNFEAIFGGISGSCLLYGVKRGLFSNEAGIGSAPNAAATADVSHPVKQGLVQMLSVFIDTLLICTATAMMCLCSGIPITKEAAGAVYVQQALTVDFGSFGPLLVTICMVLFAFTTLIGNLFYVDNCLTYLHRREPSKEFMFAYRIIATFIIFIGAIMPMAAVWDVADIFMAGMCLINIPACALLGKTAIKAMKNYEEQKKAGKNPVFKAADIGLDSRELDFWK